MKTEFDLISWNNLKPILIKLNPQLTEADLIWRHETKDDLYKSIATKLGKTKKEFEEIVESYGNLKNDK